MRRLVAVALVALVALGCTDPEPAPGPSPTAGGPATPVVDPDVERLQDIVAEMDATIAELRTRLEAASTGEDGALQDAAQLLAADVAAARSTDSATELDEEQDPDESDDADATPPLLPGPVTSRAESVGYGDLLTRTLAAARSAGSDGEPVLRFLADPLAGDLGAWQRAPDDQLAAIAAAGGTEGLEAAEPAVLALSGEASRALAWVVHGLEVPADAPDAAGRALAHLAIIELALEQLE